MAQEHRSKEPSQTVTSPHFRTKQHREEKGQATGTLCLSTRSAPAQKEIASRKLQSSPRLDGNCQVSTTLQEQRTQELSQRTVSRRHITKSNQGLERQASGTLCPTNQRVLAQDEVVRPHERVATPQAIWETEPYGRKPTDQN